MRSVEQCDNPGEFVKLKRAMLDGAAACGAFSLFRYFTRSSARVLAYHGVSEDGGLANFDGFFVSPNVFEQHLRTLVGHYHVLPLREIAMMLQAGSRLPPRAVAITFDDGYRNNLTQAAPLLKKYDLPATFFVTTGFIDGTHRPWWFELRGALERTSMSVLKCPSSAQRIDLSRTNGSRRNAACILESKLKSLSATERESQLNAILDQLQVERSTAADVAMMTWTEIAQLRSLGHEIGAHTVSHISMGHETQEAVTWEVRESIERIQKMTGAKPALYSYPYGEFDHQNDVTAQVIREAGCIGGVTTIEGFNPAGTDPFLMRRVNVTGNHNRNAFRSLVSGFTGALR